MRFQVTRYIWSEVWSRFYQRISNTWQHAKKGWQMDIGQIIHETIEKHKLGQIEKPAPDYPAYTEVEVEHVHKWSRGLLPNQNYIKQCKCGKFETITAEQWQNLA